MGEIFLKLLNLSITASWLILAVLVLRLVLKKAPKWVNCALWAMVAVRLICPFSFESALSLIPSAETVPYDIAMRTNPAIDSGISSVNIIINPAIADSFTPDPFTSANPLQIVIPVVAFLWLAGMIALLLYALISYIRLKKSVGASITIRDNILACDEVKSPFILGILKPLIYVPSSMSGETLGCVITHETAHLKRHDHWWKPLGYLLLAVYWFNPLCWVAYILLCRDIEMACDEKVIRGMDRNEKAAYSQALLDCSFPRKRIAACPLAFGEVGVKERVKSVLNYKKPAIWIVAAAIVACTVIAVCFLTNPKHTYEIKIVIPAHSESGFYYSEEQISPLQNRITVNAGENLGDTEVVLKTVEVKEENAYEPVYLTHGMPVKMEAEKGAWFRVGVNMGNSTDEDVVIYVTVDNITVRIADEAISVSSGSANATKWFDSLHGDEIVWDGMREINLDEFPGVTFRAYSERIEAVTDKKVIPLYTGMPIWSVFFCDLNGDGKPELCSSTSLGSGLIDNRFIIYDYANGASYEKSDRGQYDYTLDLQNGKLIVEKRGCMQEDLVASGELVFRDETYQIIWDKNTESSAVYLTDYPENEYTAQIPKPANGTIDYVIDDSINGRYAVFLKDITMEQSESYISELVNAGYRQMTGTKTDVAVGQMFSNNDVMLSVAYSEGVLGIQIIMETSVATTGGVDGPQK